MIGPKIDSTMDSWLFIELDFRPLTFFISFKPNTLYMTPDQTWPLIPDGTWTLICLTFQPAADLWHRAPFTHSLTRRCRNRRYFEMLSGAMCAVGWAGYMSISPCLQTWEPCGWLHSFWWSQGHANKWINSTQASKQAKKENTRTFEPKHGRKRSFKLHKPCMLPLAKVRADEIGGCLKFKACRHCLHRV